MEGGVRRVEDHAQRRGRGGIDQRRRNWELTTNLFVTVVRTGGDLKLIAWHISDDANTITRKGEATGGAISRVTIVPTGALSADNPPPPDQLSKPSHGA